ncbi:flagellar basal-body MS-ring/collar protein FliF [Alkalibacillus haloalkaliphilus]|uniref:flagellar basal-body MS-ring/collar protein FliF n=1 Tax=Alkalibacillus haloalkaliphilus TaxID=94136 RepID=UPI0002F103BB|nr:flagellar basal-body MS-ring/collar protein FliF [Alkalibacillus haloalkaliphilus]
MNETVQQYRNKITEFWQTRTNPQKSLLIGGALALLVLLISITVFASSPKMVPLYSNLSLEEAGELRDELQSRGVSHEIEHGGTTILVPESQSDELLVELAAQGMPNSGNIDYSFFSENVSWGMTDEERQIIELDALQTELSNLISNISGISDANVLINQAQETVFVADDVGDSSASIVINTEYGQNFDQNQVQSLYHLVSRAVPNLEPENIVIMNQHFEYYDLENTSGGATNTYAQHQEVRKDIERDIQRRVQQLLGTMIGQEKVVVSVTSDIDFSQENRVEEIVEPVDMDTMEGLPVSVDRVTETYAGYDGSGLVDGEADVPNLPAVIEDGEEVTQYENVRETINNEFNRARSEIVESPYEIRDLGIQVAVDNTVEEGGEIIQLSEQEQLAVEEDIQSILASIIQTSVPGDAEVIEPADKVSIVFQEFSGVPDFESPTTPIPTWLYILGAIMILIIIVLFFMLVRNKNEDGATEVVEEQHETTDVDYSIEQVETESDVRRKQLEQMAKEKPEDFAKLLRSWIDE